MRRRRRRGPGRLLVATCWAFPRRWDSTWLARQAVPGIRQWPVHPAGAPLDPETPPGLASRQSRRCDGWIRGALGRSDARPAPPSGLHLPAGRAGRRAPGPGSGGSARRGGPQPGAGAPGPARHREERAAGAPGRAVPAPRPGAPGGRCPVGAGARVRRSPPADRVPDGSGRGAAGTPAHGAPGGLRHRGRRPARAVPRRSRGARAADAGGPGPAGPLRGRRPPVAGQRLGPGAGVHRPAGAG